MDAVGEIFLHIADKRIALVIDGVKTRGEKGNYSTDRVKFDSNGSS
ncbi:hypothetical protein KBT16_19550 [Nostoc sp. CCCryo 231-06]|nr:hypothetical protein [Nostoc sp. CCCryo 231-06]